MINTIHLHPNAIARWVENSAYVKEWLKMTKVEKKKYKKIEQNILIIELDNDEKNELLITMQNSWGRP